VAGDKLSINIRYEKPQSSVPSWRVHCGY